MIVLSLMTAAGLVGCSAGGGGDGSGSSSGTNDVSAIAGLWLVSGSESTEHSYNQLSTNGGQTIYQRIYLNNNYCWLITKETETNPITHVSDNLYLMEGIDTDGKSIRIHAKMFINSDGNLYIDVDLPQNNELIANMPADENSSLSYVYGTPATISLSALQAQVSAEGECE